MKFLFPAVLLVSLGACVSAPATHHLAFRLKPGQDLYRSIDSVVKLNKINAGWMVTCSGSLTDYHIRFANMPEGARDTGHFEIVSLAGTLSSEGSHLHLSVSDSTGKTIGGHLLEGCTVYTTAEIVIAASDEFVFSREEDGTTPWKELQIKKGRH
ncbi:MAG: DNA-binding protein [Sediminibacterium sp.]|nr:DNA-binding protein [Sediminibacterium sp.]